MRTDFKSKLKRVFSKDSMSRGGVLAAVLVLALVLNILLYILTITYGLYFSSESEVELGISGNTDALFEDAIGSGKSVTITFCTPREEAEIDTTLSYIHATAMAYEQRYGDFIDVKYLNIVTHLNSDGDYVNVSELATSMEGTHTGLYTNSVIFEYTDAYTGAHNYRVLLDEDFFVFDEDNYATAYVGEETIASVISWILADEHKNAYITTYHGESLDTTFIMALATAGYYVNIIDLSQKDIPDDCDLIVISNPISDFEKGKDGSGIVTEIERLRAYVKRGGSLYISLDPAASSLPILEEFISDFGISLAYYTLEGESYKGIIEDSDNAITQDGFTLVCDYADNATANGIFARIEQYGGRVITRYACALELSGNATPILTSSSTAELYAAGERVDAVGDYCIVAASSITDADTGKTSTLMLASTAYLTSTDAMISEGYSNKNFLYSAIESLFDGGAAPYGANVVLYDTQTLENLTKSDIRAYAVLFALIPVSVAVLGTVTYIRRKNR